ncbi:peptidyl-prolyl cis-trans isomerase NIMA-interacting 1 [Drosophila elegans]|uniref:peptidyl-prolyl cis-trans isomerase NIMA-interacting 1 n=1 Tax=Drosophila elegans TaxID=30023 RepID=UPI001BC845A2|nr:peptidyl-prolyl cis-trans isomerase NIMA-interacting 1 [Drosophila elegans]
MNSENFELNNCTSESDVAEKYLYGGFIVDSDLSIGSGGLTKPTENNKLPVGWEERLAPRSKECYFYDTNTRKVYFTLPPKQYIGGQDDGWNGVAGNEYECNYRCTLRCRHILVKHSKSDRRSSFRERIVKRTKEEALDLISQGRDLITAGKIEFAELAREISDCCSARHGGDVGSFKLTQLYFGFEKEVLRLKINELSSIFETRAGYHILLRTPANNSDIESPKSRRKQRRFKKISYAIEKENYKEPEIRPERPVV